MFAWWGRVLRVDLANETTSIEHIHSRTAKDFIGGRGWAIKILYEEMDPRADPLAPENKLILATGPLTATPAPTGNRYMVITKSPLTGALSCSNAGGVFPTEMKRTGYDLFIIEGKARRPVYLWVNENQAEIRPAEHLWGKTVPETEEALRQETDAKAKVACIGPAGERKVRIAAIMNDAHRAAGRSGVGAVMGSKNLKAVVVRGDRDVPLADPVGMRELSRRIKSEVNEGVKKGSALRVYGTAYVPVVTNEVGILPTRNFQSGMFDGVEGISGETLKRKYLLRPKACFGCGIACGRLTRVDEAPYEGEGEGPEYETIAALGSTCGVGNLAAVTKANYLCNELGIDTISAGVTIACAMEMFERGIIPQKDIGHALNFGNADAVIDLIEKLAYKQGFGAALSEGSFRLAQSYGRPEFSMTAKKQEIPGYDPRGAKGMGLLYATSNKGASHMAGDLAYAEVFGVPVKIDPLDIVDKPRLIKRFEDAFAVIDAAGLCVFLSVRYLFEPRIDLWPGRLTQLMNFATGAGYTEETLLQAGERLFNLERLFLMRAGFTREDDTLPKRMLEEPMPEGAAKGHVVELAKMLSEFYRLRGWDEQGMPSHAKLVELGLNHVQ